MKGKIKLHNEKDFLSISTEEINFLTYASDGSISFKDRAKMISGSIEMNEVMGNGN